ncbi:MAG: hypothetical protein HY062_04895 [Bacteroidetes bacterium]|nr:hypothetical protein [Bacteroidota bacterium]
MQLIAKIVLLIGFVLFGTKFLALNHDSLKVTKPLKPAKHYFNTIIYSDLYGTGQRDLSGKTFVSKKLKTYQVNQFVLGFNTPVFTKDFYKKDSTVISNFHLLLTGSYSVVTPKFSGIDTDHHLSKTSFGVRMIYNTGKKSIFYMEFSPFMTQDRGYAYTQRYRIASTVVYNYTLNRYFSFRAGYSRSFMFGNRLDLPYVGIRVGRLDGINLSIQFPRSVSFNVPIGKYVKTSLYTKPQGGMYSFANTDTIYYLNNDKSLNFGRYEFLGGARVDVFPSHFFNFYVSSGLTTQNNIVLFSETYNRGNRGQLNSFYKERLKGSLFVNFGLVFKFGKTKSIYNNYNMYNAQDLNSVDHSNNVNTGNTQIPAREKTIKHLQPNEVQDLIDTQDFY